MLDRSNILAFRAAGHRLDRRAPAGDLVAVAGVIGLRDSDRSLGAALHARVHGFDPVQLDAARAAGDLVRVRGPRGTALLVPSDDVAVFTLGSLPADEQSLQVRLKPIRHLLDAAGTTATDALGAACGVARDALSSGPVGIGELSGALTRALPALSPVCRGRCGVAHIDGLLFDCLGASGVWREEPTGTGTRYHAIDVPMSARPAARAELVRRYLHCFGPSTAQQLADWCGIGVADARSSLAAAGVVEVAPRLHLDAADVDALTSPPSVTGVRLLPPLDPYLECRDRDTLVPDKTVRSRVWAATRSDGLVLQDGEPVAAWRTKARGSHLQVVVDAFAPLTDVAGLDAEAQAIADVRGSRTSEVVAR